MNTRKLIIVLVHAFVGWALCAATMGIGMATTSVENALIIHAIGVPIFFTAPPPFETVPLNLRVDAVFERLARLERDLE